MCVVHCLFSPLCLSKCWFCLSVCAFSLLFLFVYFRLVRWILSVVVGNLCLYRRTPLLSFRLRFGCVLLTLWCCDLILSLWLFVSVRLCLCLLLTWFLLWQDCLCFHGCPLTSIMLSSDGIIIQCFGCYCFLLVFHPFVLFYSLLVCSCSVCLCCYCWFFCLF